MQPHAEHHEDHAQFGKLADGLNVADEARSKRANRNPSQQVPNNCGETNTPRDNPPMKAATNAAVMLTSNRT
jgi:hypothetical protein